MLKSKEIIERINKAVINLKEGEEGEVMSQVKDDILAIKAEAMTDVKMCDMLLQMAVDNERLKMAFVCTEEQLREAVNTNISQAAERKQAAIAEAERRQNDANRV